MFPVHFFFPKQEKVIKYKRLYAAGLDDAEVGDVKITGKRGLFMFQAQLTPVKKECLLVIILTHT